MYRAGIESGSISFRKKEKRKEQTKPKIIQTKPTTNKLIGKRKKCSSKTEKFLDFVCKEGRTPYVQGVKYFRFKKGEAKK